MIFDDDSDPRTKRRKLRPLDNMSVAELKEYADQLKEEIARVEADIAKKEKHKSALEGLFKA